MYIRQWVEVGGISYPEYGYEPQYSDLNTQPKPQPKSQPESQPKSQPESQPKSQPESNSDSDQF